MVNAQNRVVGYWILPEHENHFLQRYDLIPQETCFWRRSLFEKAGNIDASYRFAMDYDLFVRFMNHGVLSATHPACLRGISRPRGIEDDAFAGDARQIRNPTRAGQVRHQRKLAR